MLNVLLFVIMFPVVIVTFLFIGFAGAIAFEWLGDKVFDMIADGQEWQQKKGWW